MGEQIFFDFVAKIFSIAVGFLLVAVLLDTVCIFIAAKVAGVIDVTIGQAFYIAGLGKFVFFLLSSIGLEVPYLGAMTPFVLGMLFALVLITTTLEVSFARGLLIFVAYVAVFMAGAYLGWVGTGETMFRFIPER